METTTDRTKKRHRWWKLHSRYSGKQTAHGNKAGDKSTAVGTTSAEGKDQSTEATTAKGDVFSGEGDCVPSATAMTTSSDPGDRSSEVTDASTIPRNRYILFVGNLPYDASAEDILAHFERRGVPVKDVRLLTKKESGKSRGIAFAEFDSSKRMQNALKLHNTKLNGRRINVEVTCGGGGKSEGRRQKIRERNKKLQQKKRSGQKRSLQS